MEANLEYMLERVVVNGKTTYETIDQKLVFERRDIEELLKLQTMRHEIPFYEEIDRKVSEYFLDTDEGITSRRHVIFLDECISMFQFLLGREEPTLIVTMRSSSFIKLKSDLAFFAKHAISKNCEKLIVNIGSLHFIANQED